jgi:hypothetical protein
VIAESAFVMRTAVSNPVHVPEGCTVYGLTVFTPMRAGTLSYVTFDLTTARHFDFTGSEVLGWLIVMTCNHDRIKRVYRALGGLLFCLLSLTATHISS